MKYVLMFTSRPDLDAEIDPEVMKADYKKIYAWFEENAARHRRRRRRAARRRDRDQRDVRRGRPRRRRRPVQRGQGDRRRVLDHRRPRHGRRDRAHQDLAAARSSPASRSRSGRWSRTTRSSSDVRRATHRRTASSRSTLREEAGPLVARLSRRYGDFDLAEEAVQSAVVEALTTWRRDGPPDNPGAWLQVAAQRNAVDGVRRSTRQREPGRPGLAAGPRPGRAPTTGSRCCSPAATRRWRPRRGWRSPCARWSA